MSSPEQLPGVFGDLQPLLQHYGYLAVGGFILLDNVGVPIVPAEPMLIAAAIFAGSGNMNIALVIVVGIVGAIIGNTFAYLIGRFGGRPLVERFGRYIFLTPERLDRTEAYINRRGGRVIVFARFVQGLRQFNGILAGTAGMHWAKFTAYNALGAVLWVCTWALLGYFAGEHIDTIYAEFDRYKWPVIGAFVLIVVAVVLRHIRRRRRTAAPEAA